MDRVRRPGRGRRGGGTTGIDDDQLAVGVADVGGQLGAPAGRVDADHHRSRQRRAGEQEQVLGGVLRQDAEVERAGRVTGGLEPRGSGRCLGQHLPPGPRPTLEQEADAVVVGPQAHELGARSSVDPASFLTYVSARYRWALGARRRSGATSLSHRRRPDSCVCAWREPEREILDRRRCDNSFRGILVPGLATEFRGSCGFPVDRSDGRYRRGVLDVAAPARILVVDDEENISYVVATAVRLEGYEVRTADAGRVGDHPGGRVPTRSGGARRDAAGPRRVRGLPPPARRRRGGPGDLPDGPRRDRGPGARPHDRGRRLPHEALQHRGAHRPHPHRAAPRWATPTRP